MDEQFILLMDFFGTAVFALTGSIKGIAHRLDLLGVVVLGCTVGIGGGVLRDSALGLTPASALEDPRYLLFCILVSLLVFLFPRKWLAGNRNIILYADAVGLGVFTAIGNAKAMQSGMPNITVVLSGVITATGGGVIRDLLVRTIPSVLKYDFYATASLLGGLLYCLLYSFDVPRVPLFWSVAVCVFLLRIIAFYRHLKLPQKR